MVDLLMEIEAQIVGAKSVAAKQNVGVIREIGDGVARIEGLSDAMLNEMIDLGHGIIGLALNLDETEVGVVNGTRSFEDIWNPRLAIAPHSKVSGIGLSAS